MDMPLPGLGTVLNTVSVTVGALLGMAVGHRFPDSTRRTVTDCLGLVTLLMAGLSAGSVTSPALAAAVGSSAPVLIVLGSLLIGGVTGSLLRIEDRLEGLVDTVRARFSPRRQDPTPGSGSDDALDPAGENRLAEREREVQARERFVEGWLTATLLFCVGPLTILGTLNDGLGRGIDELAVKSALDFFAAMAFASTFGVGVLASAVSVAVVQGTLTLVGFLLGTVMPEAQIMAMTATGGLMLIGIALRLLEVRHVRVGDLLPALFVAPLLTSAVAAWR